MLIRNIKTHSYTDGILLAAKTMQTTILRCTNHLKTIIVGTKYKTIRCKGFTVNTTHYYKNQELVESLESEIITHIGGNHIIVSDKFSKVSDNAKMFLIAHEQAHIRFGHPNKTKLDDVKQLANLGVRREEFIADGFAFDIMGKDNCIEAIVEIMSMPEITLLYRKELIERLSVITNK